MGKKSDPPAPDYKPMAEASSESARIAAELGQKQLDENKRQYEENRAITSKVVDKQLELMDQSKAQGDTYFENWKKGRDVTDKIRDEVMGDNTGTQATQRKAIADAANTAADAYGNLSEQQKKFGDDQSARIADSQNRIVNEAQDKIGSAASSITSAAEMASRGLTGSINSTADELQDGAKRVAGGMMMNVGSAAGGIGAAMSNYGGKVEKDIDLYTSGNSAIVDKYGRDIEEDVGRAVSDTRAGQSQATNQAMRQALRYGVNLPDMVDATSIDQARMLAGAANGTRVASIDKYRDITGKGVGMRQAVLDTSISAATAEAKINSDAAIASAQMEMAGKSGATQMKAGAAADTANMQLGSATSAAGMNANAAASGAQMRSAGAVMADDAKTLANNQALGLKAASIDKKANIALTERDLFRQDDATNTAKKLDVAGLYSGMTGASTGAYGLANNAGSSAVGNQNSTSGQYLQGMNAGTGTIMNGRALAQNGLGNILNAQTSVYGDTLRANASSSAGTMGAIGTVAGAAITVF